MLKTVGGDEQANLKILVNQVDRAMACVRAFSKNVLNVAEMAQATHNFEKLGGKLSTKWLTTLTSKHVESNAP